MDGKQFHTQIQLSKNRFIDNSDGSLLCKNAVLGKAGTQAYHSSELGMAGDEIIMVYRTEDEVFKDESLNSLKGKSFTLYHPDEDVTVKNFKDKAKGIVLDVRREGNLIVGDLKVFDEEIIDLIVNNEMIELSLGYDTKLVRDNEGRILQTDIVYNHVALVPKGRAEVARIIDSVLGTHSIRDKQFEEREDISLTDNKQGLMAKVLTALGLKKVEDKDDTWTLSLADADASDVVEELDVEEDVQNKDVETVEETTVKDEEVDIVKDEEEVETKTLEDAKIVTQRNENIQVITEYDDETGDETVLRTSTETYKRKVQDEDGQENKEATTVSDEKGEEEMTEFDKLIAQAKEIENIKDPELKKSLQDALFKQHVQKEAPVVKDEEDALLDFSKVTLGDSDLEEKFDFDEEIEKFYDSLNPDNFDSYTDYLKFRKQLDKETKKQSLSKDLEIAMGGRR